MAEDKDKSLPTGRLQRAAQVGKSLGGQGIKYAGTRVANLGRNEQRSRDALEDVHLESAIKMVKTLGNLKGAALKVGQLASFIDVEFLPDEFREVYQEELSKLRSHAPAMSWKKVERVLSEAWDQPLGEMFKEFDHEAAAAASIGQVHRAVLKDGSDVAVKIQYPDIAEALRADLQNAEMLMRLAKAIAPGLDAKAVAGELRERVLEELDYEFEAQSQRRFARAYKGHPFIYVPQVMTNLSSERVMVSEWVDGQSFEDVQRLDQDSKDEFGEVIYRFCFGSSYHLKQFNADVHPGNYLLMDDGRVAFLDFGMTKRLTDKQVDLQRAAVRAAIDDDAQGLLEALTELGFVRHPTRMNAEALLEHIRDLGGWYLSGKEVTITPRLVMRVLAAASDPRSDFFLLMRKEGLPADELLGRRMETGLLAVLGQLNATRNWTAISREWWFGDPPATELGKAEWKFFKSRGRT